MMNPETATINTDSLLHVDGKLNVRFIPNGPEDWIEYVRNDTSKDRLFRPVQQKDIERYPQLWSAYSSLRPKVDMDGTNLTELPGLSNEIALQFRLKNVFTVEQLAGMDDYAATGLGSHGTMFRDIAKLFLYSKGGQAKAKLEMPKASDKPVEKRAA